MSDYLMLEWYGVDGSYWNLTSGEQGVTLAPGATKLLGDSPMKTMWLKSAFGQHYAGKKVQRRDPVFSVNIEGDDPDHWHEIDSAWRMAWDYDREGQLVATTADGPRTLGLRLLEDPKAWGEKDPHLTGESTVVMTTAAAQPHYLGDTVTSSWVLPSGTAGSGTVTVSNPGDVSIWLQWVCSAPGTWTLPDFSWQDDDQATRTVKMPALGGGEHLTVDTYPEEELLISATRSLVWGRFRGNGLLFPVPPHTPPTALPVSVTGATPGAVVTVRQPRWYSRAWGVTR